MNETDQAPPRHYNQWLSYLFDREDSPHEFISKHEEPPFRLNHAEIVELITYTMVNSGRDLLRFSDSQVSLGLNIIFNNSFSDFVFSIREQTLPTMARLRALDSIKKLYSDCFEPRCAPVLDYESGANSLNHVCFMFWDVTLGSFWEGDWDENKEIFYGKVLEVMEFALESTNQACVESALHGLGHYCGDREPAIIRSYLKRHPELRGELVEYASAAAQGHVQ